MSFPFNKNPASNLGWQDMLAFSENSSLHHRWPKCPV